MNEISIPPDRPEKIVMTGKDGESVSGPSSDALEANPQDPARTLYEHKGPPVESSEIKRATFTVVKSEALRAYRQFPPDAPPPNKAEHVFWAMGKILSAPKEDPDSFSPTPREQIKFVGQDTASLLAQSDPLPRYIFDPFGNPKQPGVDQRNPTRTNAPSKARKGECTLESFRGRGVDGLLYFDQATAEPHRFALTEDQFMESFLLASAKDLAEGLQNMEKEGHVLTASSILRKNKDAMALVATISGNASTYVEAYDPKNTIAPDLLSGVEVDTVEGALESTSTSRKSFLSLVQHMRDRINSNENLSPHARDTKLAKIDEMVEALGNGLQPTPEQIMTVLVTTGSERLDAQYQESQAKIKALDADLTKHPDTFSPDYKKLVARKTMLEHASRALNSVSTGVSGTAYHRFIEDVVNGEVDPEIVSGFNKRLGEVNDPSGMFGEHNPEEDGTLASFAKQYLAQKNGEDWEQEYGAILSFLREHSGDLVLMFFMVAMEATKTILVDTIKDGAR